MRTAVLHGGGGGCCCVCFPQNVTADKIMIHDT